MKSTTFLTHEIYSKISFYEVHGADPMYSLVHGFPRNRTFSDRRTAIGTAKFITTMHPYFVLFQNYTVRPDEQIPLEFR